ALMDDEGKLIAMKTVYDQLKALPNEEISAYASIGGQPAYQEAVKKVCFKGNDPEGHVRVVASPGGSGAIKLAMYNYTNENDVVLVSDWYWSPYGIIGEETKRGVENYSLFDEVGNFNIDSFSEKFTDILNRQGRIFTIINSPGNNPTGYSLTDDEWDKVLDLAKEAAKDPEKKIVFLVDVAYIDFVRDDDASRKFFKKFGNLPSNILTIVAFSMSKGFTAYGMRMGAAIGISSDEDTAEEFYYSLMHSCRATWSNCNRGAMAVLSEIVADSKKYEEYEAEKNSYKDMLLVRANAFVEGAKECGLEILPYRDGFFVSIPCDDPMKACEELAKENLYLVPLKMGLRFAVCAVEESKCRKAPKLIKEVLDRI
ncbi:MAG: pyridoxal phosphate-dependent aminotransferase, partial [Intestinibacter sp.]|uniref:pyridoxal phosphate-dependent aminotransferase n=1 Tax=Intestinibacter sp. TaxID=1965304 RepID=UPI003F1862E5